MSSTTYQSKSSWSPAHQPTKTNQNNLSAPLSIQTKGENEAENLVSGQYRGLPANSVVSNIQRSINKNKSGGFFAPVQAKLTIGEPNDQYEQEADQVASQVVQRLHAPSAPPDDNSIQRKSFVPIVQRATPSELQRKLNQNPPSIQADFEGQLNSAKSNGKPLDNSFRAKIEPIMGADFSGVRVHTDSSANDLSHSIQAKAFTTGQNIFFGKNQYNPSSSSGQELLAHELTHVVQQNGSLAQKKVQPKYNTNLDYDILAQQKQSPTPPSVQKKAESPSLQPKLKSSVPGVIQRGFWGSIVNAAKSVGKAVVKGVGKVLGFVINIGAWVAKALIKSITGGFQSLIRIFSLPSLLTGAKLESLKDIREKLDLAKSKGRTSGVGFAAMLDVLSIIVGDIGNVAGLVSLLSGIIGLIPGAQPLLAVSGIAGTIGFAASALKTVLDGAIVAILKFSNIEESDKESSDFYSGKKKDLVTDVISLGAGIVGAGTAGLISGGANSFGEGVKSALTGGAASSGLQGIVENTYGAGLGAVTGGTAETLSGTEAEENEYKEGGKEDGAELDLKARLAQDANHKLQMLINPLETLQKTWAQIKNAFVSAKKAFTDFWDWVKGLFGKAIKEKQNDPNQGGKDNPEDQQMEQHVNPEKGEQAEEQGQESLDKVEQFSDHAVMSFADIVMAIRQKQQDLQLKSAPTLKRSNTI